MFRGWAGSEELPRHNKLWRIAEGGGGGYRLSQCKCWLEGVGTCCLHCLSQATGGKTLLVGDSDRPLPLGGGSPRRLRCTAVRRLSIQYSLGGGGGLWATRTAQQTQSSVLKLQIRTLMLLISNDQATLTDYNPGVEEC